MQDLGDTGKGLVRCQCANGLPDGNGKLVGVGGLAVGLGKGHILTGCFIKYDGAFRNGFVEMGVHPASELAFVVADQIRELCGQTL